MADVEKLLSLLEGVRQTRPNQWIARCPAHEDRSPSFSVKESGGGVILIKCFAGCESEAILSALNLSFSDLFPERLPDVPHRRTSVSLAPREIMEVIEHELTVASLILADVADSKVIDEATWARFCKAAQRIQTVRDHGR
ncbi:MAG: hypothetical protein JWO52_4074 [Gammaproteobacteria bacterium]|nr:hypothetical protein [Gammaproteobacteria bacterium]